MLRPSSNGAPSTMPSLLLVLQLCSLFSLLPLLRLTSAAPIQLPDLSQCSLASDTSLSAPIVTVQRNCCLPVQQAVPFTGALQNHVRRRAQSASADQIATYIKAYELMKALPEDDPRSFGIQADIHCAFCNGAYNQTGASGLPLQVHFSWLFLPWHRWYLYFHERILAKLVGDPDFSLVFWNWDDQENGGNVIPSMFATNGTSLYDAKRNSAHLPPSLVLLNSATTSTNTSVIINSNLNTLHQDMVIANYAELFLGGAFRTGTDLRNSSVRSAPLGGSIENGIHNAVHYWTGSPNETLNADMGTFLYAARDPIFYAHHSNVDRLWEVWRTLPGGYRQDSTDPDFLDTEFYFYDENGTLVTVTVRDALNSTALGISYEEGGSDDLWINYQPAAITNGSAVEEAMASGVPVIGAAPENGTIDLGVRLIALVARPVGDKPNNTEEVLTIQGVNVPARTSFVSLLVFVNLLNATNTTATSSAEYVGTYNVMPSSNSIFTNVKLAIGENLKLIGIDTEEYVVLTVVVEQGFSTITLQGLEITYAPNGS